MQIKTRGAAQPLSVGGCGLGGVKVSSSTFNYLTFTSNFDERRTRKEPGCQWACYNASSSSRPWEESTVGAERPGHWPASADNSGESGGGRRPVCPPAEMEMTSSGSNGDSKGDYVNCDGLIGRNSGDATEITVPLSLPKRMTLVEGNNLYRLRDRKFVLEDKKRLCAWALGVALLGVLLMICRAEMCPSVYHPVSRSPTG